MGINRDPQLNSGSDRLQSARTFMWGHYQTPPVPPQGLGICRREAERREEPQVVDNAKEMVSYRHNRTDAHVSSQRLWRYIEDLTSPRRSQQRMENVHKVPCLTKKLFAIGTSNRLVQRVHPIKRNLAEGMLGNSLLSCQSHRGTTLAEKGKIIFFQQNISKLCSWKGPMPGKKLGNTKRTLFGFFFFFGV